jgi:hypothetical protein
VPERKRWKGQRTRMMWLSGTGVDACARANKVRKSRTQAKGKNAMLVPGAALPTSALSRRLSKRISLPVCTICRSTRRTLDSRPSVSSRSLLFTCRVPCPTLIPLLTPLRDVHSDQIQAAPHRSPSSRASPQPHHAHFHLVELFRKCSLFSKPTFETDLPFLSYP